MYIKNIRIENYGAIDKFDYKCKFDLNGNPIPLVLVGLNGSGKTLALSSILDAFIECKRNCYNDIIEVEKNQLYVIRSRQYIKNNEDYTYINIEFDNDVSYSNAVVGNPLTFDYMRFKEYGGIDINNSTFKQSGFYENATITESQKQVFEKNVILYFPVDRYYIPAWKNCENNSVEFKIKDNWYGKSYDNIIKENIMEDVESWILDVIIDKLIYEQNVEQVPVKLNDKMEYINKVLYTNGKNTTIQKLINEILCKIYSNNKNYHEERIGISPKEHRTVSIMAKNKNNEEIELSHNFKHLSSGEIMILAMFCDILKEADRISDGSIMSLDEITGVVIIDEIDAHLHSNFSKEILPSVIKLFPKIQFIVSSHSPFFLLGMKDEFANNCDFINMPDGIKMGDVENFEEVRKCYEMLDKNNQEMRDLLAETKEKLEQDEIPLIITEGKTDRIHIENALNYFINEGEFEEKRMSFLEYNDAMGEIKLWTLLKNLSQVPNAHKIIGIFDCDTKEIKELDDFKDLGNNVYAIRIPNPYKYPFGISIEFLYKLEDIKIKDEKGRRLYLSDEFMEKSHAYIQDKTIITTNNAVKAYYAKKDKQVKIIDSDVFNNDDESLALSKYEFAKNIAEKKHPFENVDLTGFKELIKKIYEIILK